MVHSHYWPMFTLFVVCYIHLLTTITVNCEDKEDLIIMGDKCNPSIVKTGKKKDLIILGQGGCHKEKKHEHHHTMHYPVPIIHHEKPKVYIKHEHIMHKPRYGGVIYDHSHYGGHYGGYYGGGGDYEHEPKYEEIHHYGAMDQKYFNRK